MNTYYGTEFYRTEKDGFSFIGTVEFDQIPVRGNAMASGDDAEDKAYEDSILARLDDGDIWAWCVVTVTCKHKSSGIKSCASIGGCNYKDAEDFIASGYIEDLCRVALDDCQNEMARVKMALA